MRLIIEEIDGSIYQDIILTEDEAHQLIQAVLLEGMAVIKTRRYYVGIRVGDKWRYTENSGFLDNKELE